MFCVRDWRNRKSNTMYSSTTKALLAAIAAMIISTTSLAAAPAKPGAKPLSPAKTAKPPQAAPATVAVKPKPLPSAGDLAPFVTVMLTGDRIARSALTDLITREVLATARPRSGAGFKIRPFKAPRFLNRGETRYLIVPVRFYGPGYAVTTRYSIVTLENVVVEDFPESVRLYVSNNPETLVKTGRLLDGEVRSLESVRYISHHKNLTGAPINYFVTAYNNADTAALMQVTQGYPCKNNEEMEPGHRTARQFAANAAAGLSRIITIPPGGSRIIESERLVNGEVVSSLGELRLLAGEYISFQIKVAPEKGKANPDMIGFANEVRGHGTFGKPFVDIADTFTVGGRWRFIGVGDKPLIGLTDPSAVLKGNYGVTYRIAETVENPHPAPEKVEIHFAATAGPAIATVTIDGKPYNVPISRPPNTTKVEEIVMQPGETRVVRVEIIPESGSFYPVRIVFKSRKI